MMRQELRNLKIAIDKEQLKRVPKKKFKKPKVWQSGATEWGNKFQQCLRVVEVIVCQLLELCAPTYGDASQALWIVCTCIYKQFAAHNHK